MKKIISFFLLFTFSIFLFSQQNTSQTQTQSQQVPQCMKDFAKMMNSKNLRTIVFQQSKNKGVFIGVQYLGKMAMVIYAEVPKENRGIILKNIKSKNYQRAYQLLNVLVGNKVTTISDSEYDTLKISDNSTDFVRIGNKTVFFNPDSGKVFKNKEEFRKFRDKYNKLYLDAIKEALRKLK